MWITVQLMENFGTALKHLCWNPSAMSLSEDIFRSSRTNFQLNII